MGPTEIKNILDELYVLEPSLKEYENELMKLLEQMSGLKPDTKFDKAFAAQLKNQLIAQLQSTGAVKNKPLFNIFFMNNKIYAGAGVLAVVIIAILIIWPNTTRPPEKPKLIQTAKNITQFTNGITKSADNAFGKLNLTLSNESASSLAGASGKANAPASSNAEVATVSNVQDAKSAGKGSTPKDAVAMAPQNTAINSKMIASPRSLIMPYYGFKYSYKGDEIKLDKTSMEVYKRLKGDGQLGKELAKQFGTDFGLVNLGNFSNLKLNSLSFDEEKDFGFTINIDLNEENISISESWDKWRIPERDNCRDQACWDKFRVKLSDMPSDEELIKMSDQFLADKKINLDNYGGAKVENDWRKIYESSDDKANYYFPEVVSVVYPIKINNQEIQNQFGNYSGLRVNINVLQKKVSGLSDLKPFRYQSSNYETETNAQRIIKLAENGGNNYVWNNNDQATKINLGTPNLQYVQVFRYENNSNEEFIVPALVFPTVDTPKDYWGNKSITIPLTKEMLDQIENPQTPDGVMPMMMKGSSGATEVAPASAPVASPNIDIKR